jgi:ABC-type nitrate/sulfonate/bicarbonate transport system substrate-binding protein
MSKLRITSLIAASLLAVAATACGDDGDSTAGGDTTAAESETTAAESETTAAPEETETTAATDTTAAGESGAIDAERCAANEAAGTITYLSSFDFAAAASIVDVVVADAKGYFEELCLDVELRPSFSTANYTLVAGGEAQFSSAGNYTEILNFSRDGAEFVALVNYGKTPIESLLVRPETADLAGLDGSTIGVKGDLPPSLVAMLSDAGLARGTAYSEVLLDGFDPKVHWEQPIDALPVYKSNEPGQLDAAGIEYTEFDPTDFDIPGTFGILYTTPEFMAEHPTAAEDFIRAALRGMEDAVADPQAAVEICVEAIEAAGNQNFLSLEGEGFRWEAELAEVVASTPDGDPVGLIDGALFEAEIAAYDAAGVFADGAPDTAGTYDEALVAGLYGDDGKVIWPG